MCQVCLESTQEKSAFSAHRYESVDVALFLLAVSPDSRHSLVVIGWIPVRVKHDKSVCTNQIQATASRLAAQHEYKLQTLETNRINQNFDMRANSFTEPKFAPNSIVGRCC